MNHELFVQNVKRICKDKGISATEACRESGAGRSLIDNVKRGRTPSIDRINLLADFLGVTSADLLEEKKAPTPVSERPPGLSELDRIYLSLNNEGQEKLLDYATDLEASGRYIKSRSDQLGQEKDA